MAKCGEEAHLGLLGGGMGGLSRVDSIPTLCPSSAGWFHRSQNCILLVA